MTKYIENKKVEENKANNVPNLNSIDEAICNFISAIYNSGWDLLIVDKNNHSFRQKVAAQFTPRLSKIKTSNRSENKMNKPASFIKLLSLILAKYLKKLIRS